MQNVTTTSKTAVKELAGLLKALADESRLTIMTMLQDGQLCVCEIMEALPFSQPAVSHHLKTLRQAGLISDRREGKWIFYSLNPQAISDVGELLQKVLIIPMGEQVNNRSRSHPLCKKCD